jgi:methylmalonyl-CoA mutase N-terminal domain/subunit
VLLAEIDRRGGALSAIESGFVQRAIQDAAYADQQAVDAGERVVVGVNRFVSDQEPEIEVLHLDPDIERRQAERLREVRAGRSADAWKAAIDRVVAAARDGSNLLPPIIGAVEAYATVGEIADAMRGVFGEYRETGA